MAMRTFYQRNVPEYWIIDTEPRLVERWLPGDQHAEILRDHLTRRPLGAATPFVMDLQAFFAKIYGEEKRVDGSP